MLRFRLGRIPVEIHPSHLLVAALFGWLEIQSASGHGWPGEVLRTGDPVKRLQTQVAGVVLWMAIVFVSVLVHELGHGFASLAFGYRPAIQLAWLGGNTQPNAPGRIPWARDVVLTAAGPALGAALGLLCWGALRVLGGRSSVLDYALAAAAAVNAYWAVLNLVPVLPLDGGRISAAVLTRFFGRKGLIGAHLLSLLASAVACLLYFQNTFVLILFGMFGFQSLRVLAMLFRREDAAVVPESLSEPETLFKSGELERARSAAESLLAGAPVPATRSRAHHLLGWVALKQGEGRRALDHFSQVQGRVVEPQAVAAAFSLVGDEDRALPLWEAAHRTAPNPTVLHEWAGALIRAGRADQAGQMPGVDLASAYACAERVAFLRGAFSEAARFGLQALERRPSAEQAYEVACALARAGDADRAVELLDRASALGFKDMEFARTDADLAVLHGNPGFERWAGRAVRGESTVP